VKNSAKPRPLSIRDEREVVSLRDLSARVAAIRCWCKQQWKYFHKARWNSLD